MSLGTNIADLRQRAGMSQDALAILNVLASLISLPLLAAAVTVTVLLLKRRPTEPPE